MKIDRSDGDGSKGKCACVGEREDYKEEMGMKMEWHVLRSLSCKGCMSFCIYAGYRIYYLVACKRSGFALGHVVFILFEALR